MEIITLTFFALCIYLWVQVSSLRKDVDVLRRGGAHASVAPTSTTVPVSENMAEDVVQRAATQRPASSAYVYTPPQESAFMKWLKEDWLVKLGALLLFLGVGWFIPVVAFQIIGPIGRIVLGLLFGIAVMILGVWRIRTRTHQGAIFTVLGSTIVLMVMFAARAAYDMFTPLSALTIMFCSVFLVAFMAIRYNRQSLGLASIILAGIAPLLTYAPEPNAAGLFTYLLVVVLGTLWVVYYTGWVRLTVASILLVFLYGLPFMMSHSADQEIVFLFALIFTAIFFSTNIASILYQKSDTVRGVQLVVALGTVLYVMAWIATAAATEYKVLLYLAWMMVFALGSFVVFWYAKIKGPFYVYGGASVALLAAATAEIFHGPALTIAFTVEVAAMVMASLLVRRKTEGLTEIQSPLVAYVSILFAVPVVLSLPSMMSSSWSHGVWHQDLFVLLTLMIALLASSLGVSQLCRPLTDRAKNTGLTLLLLGGIYGLVLVWLVLHATLSYDTASMLSLVMYSVLGIALYVSGKVSLQPIRKTVGSILVGAVMFRLLTVEIWQMAVGGRIITFLIIGVLLMSTAFIGKKK